MMGLVRQIFKKMTVNSLAYVACCSNLIRERSASAQQPGFGEQVMHQLYHVKNATQVIL